MKAVPFLLTYFTAVQAALIPASLNPISTQDASIPGSLPMWSFVLTTRTCEGAATPKIVLAQLASGTTGTFIYPPVWQSANAAMIQDPQVYNVGQLNQLALTNTQGPDWQLCGLEISINNALVYQDTNQVTVASNQTYALTLEQLQANPNWVQTTQVCNPPATFSVYDIQLLAIGKIGNFIGQSQNGIDWQQNAQGDYVGVSLNTYTQTVSQLQYTDSTSNSTVPFNLVLDIIVNCGSNVLTVQATNLATSFIDQTAATTYQSTVNSLVAPLAYTQSLPATFCPNLAVNSDGSITFSWPLGVGNIGPLCWNTN